MKAATLAQGIGALACAAVALVSYCYLVSFRFAPPSIASNAFAHPWLLLHVIGSATALLLGPLQFVTRLRSSRPRLHRWTGRLYVAGCVGGGIAGFVLALGATSGIVATLGFGALAIAWLGTTIKAWASALTRDFVAHRAWMIRSFALTAAAVTLRLYLPLADAIPGLAFVDGYRVISFLCWVPNLLVAQVWLRSRTP